MTRIDYRIEIQYPGSKEWFKHGPTWEFRDQAVTDVRNLREYYGRHGMKFRLLKETTMTEIVV